jgi:hypothetical protein
MEAVVYKKVDRFTVFSKTFVQLSDEGQDTLVKTAHQLLKTHEAVKGDTDEHEKHKLNDEQKSKV